MNGKPGRPVEYDDVRHRNQRRYQANWIAKHRETRLEINRRAKARRKVRMSESKREVSDEELDKRASEWLRSLQ